MSADLQTQPATTTPPVAAPPRGASLSEKVWDATWPKVLAVFIAVALWQIVVWSGWKPEYLLPGPQAVFPTLWESLQDTRFWDLLSTTMRRGVVGFAIALVLGSLLGIAVSQWKVLRAGVGSMITGLQTMPSIAWFPLAILLFGLTENAIYFVIILGAAPSIANGIISGIDEVPPNLLRAGQMLGARGIDRYRYVILPAALPSYLSGLKQGWAFAWRSLLAGELLVNVPGVPSLGGDMTNARNTLNSELLIALMIVILILGMLIDVLFSSIATRVRVRRGLTGLHGTA